jgi:hypothetical protein
MSKFKELFEQILNKSENKNFENKIHEFFEGYTKSFIDDFKLWAKKNIEKIEKIKKIKVKYDLNTLSKILDEFIIDYYNVKNPLKTIMNLIKTKSFKDEKTVGLMLCVSIEWALNELGISIS